MSKNVLVVGSINVDYVINTDRLPKLGETITGRDFAMNFGGKGANQAAALAKAGCSVKMLGAVGTEDLPCVILGGVNPRSSQYLCRSFQRHFLR